MNILYIHGLDSKLSPEKKAILSQFGHVSSPDINYYTNPSAIDSILQEIKGRNIDVVIGSSIGGFAAYYVSLAIEKPALMFNPALKKRSVAQEVPTFSRRSVDLKLFILGAQDEVVDPAHTLGFLSLAFNEFTDYHIHIRPELTHNIPLDVFENEVASFFKLLNRE